MVHGLKKNYLGFITFSASMAMTMLAGCGSNTDKKDDTKKQKAFQKMMRQKQRLTAKMRRSLSWKMELIR